ncbi:hypothetical protein QAD02_023142 [Eretmocerus hayati]|uniref:Uncharacterized protein n=1 Tax=Eretmocerus hayati TaxID=131215 RepID=A0ACC2PW47_9HYME|nr:hypothetical protein QAD02_023142 [Eretmocerus hayati]
MSAVDDVYDSWEEMEDSGALDKKLQALNVNPEDENSTSRQHNTDTRIIILGDETMRTQYMPKQAVKILKRPDRQEGPMLNGDKPKQPIKSLKQREQEYAEARKRILGEEKSPEELLEAEVNRIQGKTLVPGSSNLPTNVTRMPNGPDGTKGFNVRR